MRDSYRYIDRHTDICVRETEINIYRYIKERERE